MICYMVLRHSIQNFLNTFKKVIKPNLSTVENYKTQNFINEILM